MPRLFTGLELPDAVVGQLALMRGGVIGARWLEPEDYHITLRFVGNVDARTARDIDESLADSRRPGAPIRFEGLSWFGGDKPRAIVAKVRPEPALMDLQAEQERHLRRIGIEPETRKYAPHVTLARVRGASQTAVASYLATRGALVTDSFAAERFVLYSAREVGRRDPISLRPPIRWANDGPMATTASRIFSRSTRSMALRCMSSRRPRRRTCASPGRRAIATCRIFTGSRRSESNGCKINALDLAERGQKRLGQLAGAFSGSFLGPRPRDRATFIRDAAPISSIFRNCRFPALGGAARRRVGLPGRRRVDPHGGAHAGAGAESAC
jgi:RNA 2',3'-cyclic 3'-phosphodiesterase